MKKNIVLFLAMVLMVGTLFAGCGKESGSNVAAETVAANLHDGIKFEDELMEIGSGVLDNFYPKVAADQLNGFKVYKSSSGATAEEIAVFEAKDANGVADLEQAINTRVEDLRAQFEDYVPAELKRIESAIIETHGNTVVLVITGDPDTAQKILDDLF